MTTMILVLATLIVSSIMILLLVMMTWRMEMATKNPSILIKLQQSSMKRRYHLCTLISFLIKMQLVMIALLNKIWSTITKTILLTTAKVLGLIKSKQDSLVKTISLKMIFMKFKKVITLIMTVKEGEAECLSIIQAGEDMAEVIFHTVTWNSILMKIWLKVELR